MPRHFANVQHAVRLRLMTHFQVKILPSQSDLALLNKSHLTWDKIHSIVLVTRSDTIKHQSNTVTSSFPLSASYSGLLSVPQAQSSSS